MFLSVARADLPSESLAIPAMKDSKEASLRIEHLGQKLTVVIFVTTDCPVSNRYAPEYRRLVDEYRPKGVAFVFAYVDPETTWKQVKDHQSQLKFSGTSVLDVDHQLAKALGAITTPEAVVLSRDGKMHYRGRIDDRYVEHARANSKPVNADLRNALTALLGGKEPSVKEASAIGCAIPGLDEQ